MKLDFIPGWNFPYNRQNFNSANRVEISSQDEKSAYNQALNPIGKSKFRVSFWLHLIFETFGWFSHCFNILFTVSSSFSGKEESPRLSGALPDVFSTIYIYIIIVEHFNKDTFVLNTVIRFNRDQLVFIFILILKHAAFSPTFDPIAGRPSWHCDFNYHDFNFFKIHLKILTY